MKAYRIVEIKGGKVMSLFHGTNKSRTLPLDTWVKADKKLVMDGSRGSKYESGFHALESMQLAEAFFNTMFRIKKDRYIIPVEIRSNIRPKHENKKVRNCLLADEIYINSSELRELGVF